VSATFAAIDNISGITALFFDSGMESPSNTVWSNLSLNFHLAAAVRDQFIDFARESALIVTLI